MNSCECGKPKGNRARACADCRKADLVCPGCSGSKFRYAAACNRCTARARGDAMIGTSHAPTSLRHGHSWAGGCSPTYASWRAMRYRCRPEGKYGVRGITVCERWSDFALFLADMGERPEGMTLDRIAGGLSPYEPGNCRWASPAEQRVNSKRNRHPKGCACGNHVPTVHSAETRAKISASKMGHEVSAETRAKIGAANRARRLK